MISQDVLTLLASRFTDKASAEDIYYCFRLILGRNPNPEERVGHFSRVGLPLEKVVRSFVQSLEFENRNLLKAKSVNTVTLVEREDMALYIDADDTDVGPNIVVGVYEPHVQAIFRRFLGPGMAALDIGANIGVLTMLAAKLVGPTGKVLAIEPNAKNVRLIEASRRRNGYSHVEIHCVAAAEKAGILVLHQSGSNGMVAPAAEDLDALLRSSIVPAVRLDSIVPADLPVGFVKVHVERYEFKALQGLERTLRRWRPVIVSEFSPPAMEPGEGAAYLAYLIQLGYSLGVLQQSGLITDCGDNLSAVRRMYWESGVDHIDIVAQPSSNSTPVLNVVDLKSNPILGNATAPTPGGSFTTRVLRRLNRSFLRQFDAVLPRRTAFGESAQSNPVLKDEPGAIPETERDPSERIMATASSAPTVRLLSGLDQLDSVLKECDAACAISDDAMREVFKTFEFRLSDVDLPIDPFSPEYRTFQFELYKRISGRDYKLENEFTPWLVTEQAIDRPFPYYTQSYRTVSDHILMLGLIIKVMALKPGARIIEFGCGYGNTSINLARMGYEVTAVDIEPRYLEIIERQCRWFTLPPRTVLGDFSILEKLQEQFDAILFYESFHHCSDHQRMVASFEARLAPTGIVVFASEPIYEGNPMPWGLRLDGQSLWAIRRFGWLELGFKESYFRDLLGRSGWVYDKHIFPVTELGTIYVARRATQDPAASPALAERRAVD
jgi:FkbM family methyltransferase